MNSPFKKPEIWQNGADCLFLDSDEATKEQLGFIARVKKFHELKIAELYNKPYSKLFEFRVNEPLIPYETELTNPKKIQHVDLEKISKAQTRVDELFAVLKSERTFTIDIGITNTQYNQTIVKVLFRHAIQNWPSMRIGQGKYTIFWDFRFVQQILRDRWPRKKTET